MRELLLFISSVFFLSTGWVRDKTLALFPISGIPQERSENTAGNGKALAGIQKVKLRTRGNPPHLH